MVLHAAAWAATPAPQQEPPTGRVGITIGAALRAATNDGVSYVGVAPTVVHGNGAYFFNRWLGVMLDGSFETFAVIENVEPPGVQRKTQLFGFRLAAEGVARWSPLWWIGIELHVGVLGGTWPLPSIVSATEVRSDSAGHIGPTIGFALAFEPDGPVGGQIWGRVAASAVSSLSAGGQLYLGRLTVGQLRGAVLIETEFDGFTNGQDAANKVNGLQFRAGLGIRLRHQPPAPVIANGGGDTTLRGRVVTGGIGLSNATVTAPGLPSQTSTGGGDFDFGAVAPGRYVVKAVVDGYKPATQTIEVISGQDANVTLALLKPTGPGTIKGVVKGDKEAPIEGAEISVEGGKGTLKTGADGAFVIAQVGPGPTKVGIKAKGYKDGEEVVQVPPEAEAQLTVVLIKQGERAPATIRGSVKSAAGKPMRALVKISEVNQTIPLKSDGRFVVQVPGGKYTVTIEAAGYVTQMKTVEVADGDQAIFHCDLQPVGR